MIKDNLQLTEEEYKELNKIEDNSIKVNAQNIKKVY